MKEYQLRSGVITPRIIIISPVVRMRVNHDDTIDHMGMRQGYHTPHIECHDKCQKAPADLMSQWFHGIKIHIIFQIRFKTNTFLTKTAPIT